MSAVLLQNDVVIHWCLQDACETLGHASLHIKFPTSTNFLLFKQTADGLYLQLTVNSEYRQHLWPSVSSSLIVHRTRLSTVGHRAFPVPSRTWNSLSQHINPESSKPVFRTPLKTHLFSLSVLVLMLWSALAVTDRLTLKSFVRAFIHRVFL